VVFKNWRALITDERFDLLKPPLRIRYAIDKGFEVGLWRPEDIKTKPEDHTFAAKLRNLGWAVGVVGPTR
jgi:hypothetical protein